MASSSSASDWVCGACVSSNKRGKYCTMCATPRPTCKVVIAALAADFPITRAAVAAPAEVAKVMAKKIFPAPTPGAVVDAPSAVAAVPAAVAKIPGQSLVRQRRWQRMQGAGHCCARRGGEGDGKKDFFCANARGSCGRTRGSCCCARSGGKNCRGSCW